ncbi:MAG: hypothetical protein U0667_08905 [Chloroflexota bacterium]
MSTFFLACTDNVVSAGKCTPRAQRRWDHKRETGWEDYPDHRRHRWRHLVGHRPEQRAFFEPLPDYQLGFLGRPDRPRTLLPRRVGRRGRRHGPSPVRDGCREGEAGWKMVGGTSGAAPFWAGVMALAVQQKAQAAGIERLGLDAAVLPAASLVRGVPRRGPGRQRLDDVAGWDKAMGIGTP